MEPRVRVMHKGKRLGCKQKSHQRLPPRRQSEQLVPPRSPGSICAAGPACSRGGAAPRVSRRGGCRTAVQVELLGLRHNAARVQPPPLPRQARARHKSGPRPRRRRRRPPTLGSRAGFPQRLGDRLPNVAAEQAEQQRGGPAHLRAAGAAGRSGSPLSVTGGRAPRLLPWRCGSARPASRPIGRGPAAGRSLLRAPRRASPDRRGRSAGALTPSCPAPRPRERMGPGPVVPSGGRRAAGVSPPSPASPDPCAERPGAPIPRSGSRRPEAFDVMLGYLRVHRKQSSLGCDLPSCSCPSH